MVPSYDSSIAKGDNDEENASKSFLQSQHSFCSHQVLKEVAVDWRKR